MSNKICSKVTKPKLNPKTETRFQTKFKKKQDKLINETLPNSKFVICSKNPNQIRCYLDPKLVKQGYRVAIAGESETIKNDLKQPPNAYKVSDGVKFRRLTDSDLVTTLGSRLTRLTRLNNRVSKIYHPRLDYR